MGSIYRRGRKLWVSFKGADGKRRRASTPFCVGQEGMARELLGRVEAKIEGQRRGRASRWRVAQGRLEAAFLSAKLSQGADPGAEWVYFLQEAGDPDAPVKIGRSTDPFRRLRALQTAYPRELAIIGICPGGKAREEWFHAHLHDSRLHGEWFAMSARLRAALSDLALRPVGVGGQAAAVPGGGRR